MKLFALLSKYDSSSSLSSPVLLFATDFHDDDDNGAAFK